MNKTEYEIKRKEVSTATQLRNIKGRKKHAFSQPIENNGIKIGNFYCT
jgi:hypothetical protein